LKKYFIDLGIMNAIAADIAFVVYLGGYNILDMLVFLLFNECRILLILGGLFGFLCSGAFYYSLKKIIAGEKSDSGKNMKTGFTLLKVSW
jgi:hypothetical protein